MSATILLNGVHFAVSEWEAIRLQPLVAELEALSGRPFANDAPAALSPPPPHVLTPLRLRGIIRARLADFGATRAAELEARIYVALTINGKSIADAAREDWARRGAR